MQDCLVGLLFAFMPVLATTAAGAGFDISLLITVMARVAGKLAVLAVGALVVARTVLPPATRWLARRYGADSFQLTAIAFCLLCALGTARQGVSAELGAFVAGVMLSATEQQETVLHHLGARLAGGTATHSCAGLRCEGSDDVCAAAATAVLRGPVLPALHHWPRASDPRLWAPCCGAGGASSTGGLKSRACALPSSLCRSQNPSPSSSWPCSSPPPAWC